MTLTEAEVRAVVRLLAEALTPDDGRAAKVGRLMDGLCGMVGAEGWVWARSRLDDLDQPVNIDYLYGGMTSGQVGRLAERMFNTLGPGSEFGPLEASMSRAEHFSLTRRQMVDDPTWREDATMAAVREAGLDEVMYSWFPVPDEAGGSVWSGTWFYRSKGKPAFDPRASRIAHLVMSECQILHADGLDLEAEPQLNALTPKQRLVLSQLIDGQGSKQIAHHLELSPHTVNWHIKAIYKHFDVQSRAELMRYFMSARIG
jgi:DNA-binding CsgD family transcriptional regulator